ncbi:hypothetical protein Bca52824_019523 [Brassica carinata]|uniref:Uncharacterized protein n=1 Tax=Brassica carinata TaxID=52824 RepID=A0A8X7VRY6_BRACI|nr:hypothetical protein Bca52824_019523 [Brassica carinata]
MDPAVVAVAEVIRGDCPGNRRFARVWSWLVRHSSMDSGEERTKTGGHPNLRKRTGLWRELARHERFGELSNFTEMGEMRAKKMKKKEE